MEVRIREWKPEDKYELSGLLNNKKVQDNLRDGIPFPYTLDDAAEFIKNMIESDKEKIFPFAIEADRKLIGSIGAFRQENIHSQSAEVGYYIGEEYWGKGITSEALKQICSTIFRNTNIIRIFAEPFATNKPSCRVLEKAGFIYEGTMVKNAVKNGIVKDMKLYAITK